jgi:mannose-6-phosphate isomerase-like protein (cupin superfamily)
MSTDAPIAIRRADAELKLWGDPVAGQVNDWIYVFGERLCELVFSMPPGARFTQSEVWKPIYGADELYYILQGTLVLGNPQTGEVVRAQAGDALRFRRDTWHHGFNAGDEELQVLEFFAPADPAGSVQASADGYGAALPLLEPRYVRDDLLEAWPAEPAARLETDPTIRLIERRDWLWRLEGSGSPLLVGVLLSTPGLTAAVGELLPGRQTDVRRHGGDLAGYVLEGRLNVFLPEEPPERRWVELHPTDAFALPAGTPHQYFNMTGSAVRFLLGVAPSYLAEPAA